LRPLGWVVRQGDCKSLVARIDTGSGLHIYKEENQMKQKMIYINRPVPLYETPFLLRIFGWKKMRYRYDGSWRYAKDIGEVIKQLNEMRDDEYF
jgi:hypothetical protein